MYDNKIKEFFSSAAYSDKSLDKVGSGDAMLANHFTVFEAKI